MGIRTDAATERKILAAGGTPQKRGKPPLAAPAFEPLPGGGFTCVVGVVTASEGNARSWKARSQRTRAARAAVCGLLGRHLRAAAGAAEHYHAGGTLRVVLTRLGGNKLDRSNLGGALKGCEDALCLVLGADDGDDRWDVSFKQDPAAPAAGVRFEVQPLKEEPAT